MEKVRGGRSKEKLCLTFLIWLIRTSNARLSDLMPLGAFISTAMVTDAEEPFETAICHDEYNSGKHVIVAHYPTREKAAEGHEKWVSTMTGHVLPDRLVDVGIADVKLLLDDLVSDVEHNIFVREPKSPTPH